MLCRLVSIMAVCLTLTGCGTGWRAGKGMSERETMPDDKLAQVVSSATDQQLCDWSQWNSFVGRPLGGARTGALADQEKMRRGLGDCSADHFKCVSSYGVKFGTQDYTNCRVALDVNHQYNDAANRQMGLQMMQMGQQMMQPPPAPSPVITCTNNPMASGTMPNPYTCR